MSDSSAPSDAFANPFVDARASAVIANEVARDVLRHLDEADGSSHVAVVEPVSDVFPHHPLDTAVRDLAIATLAAARTAEMAWRGGIGAQAAAAGDAARMAARTLALLDTVAGSAALRADAHERVRVAHAAAATSFAAADLMRRFGADGRGGAVRGVTARAVALPPSWRRLIGILSHAIAECEAREPEDDVRRSLVNAARAAHDGAQAVWHVSDGLATAPSPALVRFARVAALSAAYAGCAALVPLRP